MGLRGTHLRRLHGHARHCGPGRGGGRPAIPGARPGPPHARPGQRRPGHPGPRHPLLPAPGHGLGGRDVRPEGGPQGNRRHRQIPFRLAPVLRHVLCRGAEKAEGLHRPRPVLHFHERLLGPPGLQAAAGGEPAGCGALSPGPGLAAGHDQDPHHPGRQEPAPELPGGRHGLRHQHEQ